MIECNLTDLEEKGIAYLEKITDNKRIELRDEMVKFLKQNTWPDSSEYGVILEFIDDFFMTTLKKADLP